MMIERRSALRLPVDIWATLVSDDGVDRISVNVVNLSRSGAGIALGKDHPLPREFYVLFPDHKIQPCTLAWRDDHGAGLEFCF